MSGFYQNWRGEGPWSSDMGMKPRPGSRVDNVVRKWYIVDMKQSTHFRLTPEGKALLQQMAESDGIPATAMLEIAIREAARKRGLHAHPGIQTENQPEPTERH